LEITLKNFEIINVIKIIDQLLQIDNLLTKAKFNLTKNYMKCEQSLKTFEKCKYDILSKYAFKDEQGNFQTYDKDCDDGKKGEIKFRDLCKEKAINELNELANLEDVIDFLPINISYLPETISKDINLYPIIFMLTDE
jgi:hypothetical protein